MNSRITHVVSLSGGLASTVALARTLDKVEKEKVQPVFMDTKDEDDDLYRFLDDIEKKFEIDIVTLADGRDLWELAFDRRYIPNSRIDTCSETLKRNLFYDHINYFFTDPVLVFGFDASEIVRIKRLEKYLLTKKLRSWFPLLDDPEVFSEDAKEIVENDFSMKIPSLYSQGFKHNNCGGFCFKAGQKQFKLLLEKNPELYRYHEKQELAIRKYLNKDVAIIKKQVNGEKQFWTLRKFRKHIEKGRSCDENEMSFSCDCLGVDRLTSE